jgi:nickel-dependent lactate racemase
LISDDYNDWFRDGVDRRDELIDFFSETDNVLIVVNDHTRPTPTLKILQSIEDFTPYDRCSFIIASGAHRDPDDVELKNILGDYIREDNIIYHRAGLKKDLDYIGTTSSGNEIYLNKAIRNFNSILAINSIEPHYFAGFTGGRKSFLPGISGRDTIERNHSLAINAGSAPLKLKGNPVHEEMDEVVDLLSDYNIFAIQVSLNRENEIYNIHTGDIRSAFNKCCEECKGLFSIPFSEKADVVIAVAGSPLDINLYQSQKAIENSKVLLKDDGILLLISSCYEGIGPDAFYQLLSSGKDFAELKEEIKTNYRLGYHKVLKLIDLFERNELWVISEFDDITLRKIHINPVKDIDVALKKIYEKKGENVKIAILEDATTTVPVLKR